MNPDARFPPMDIDEQVTYFPVKRTAASNAFYDGDIVMKEVRQEQNGPPVYYAYRCLPLEFPLTLKGTQYEVVANLPALQKAESKQLFTAKQLDEYDPRQVATEKAAPVVQRAVSSLPLHKMGPQYAHSKNLNLAVVHPRMKTVVGPRVNGAANNNAHYRELMQLSIDNDLAHGHISEEEANALRNNLQLVINNDLAHGFIDEEEANVLRDNII
ncbi:hypothetical protein [Choristoneura rosaceana nucleopolyhedrovirus]|uniref:Uncharacterized protein n=1 Tax=Choristoneura rosaceana nucleopolyhedrovirus TaxID=58094 RepID=S5MRB3_9ABAC|nr:hypothetical protein [Choristoneura rosaceana nucleopolyhedrovirus]AGR57178.1 hypothetical protein [Choristoneura rosaceana nucleopolyhedrovirus]